MCFSITISNIDKDTPIGTITYSTLDKADKIIAFIDFDEENVSILNNGGLSSYTFTENYASKFQNKPFLRNILQVCQNKA